MGQNSSVAVGASKVTPEKEDIIVDASDSCVSGVKLRSTGIIPISELIKQEKCSKNIQKIEESYYNRIKAENVKQPTENSKSKKKPDFIETSYEDVPARRQWMRRNSEPKKSYESDAVKIGIKKPSKSILNSNKTDNRDNIYHKRHSNKESKRKDIREQSRNSKRENIQENNRIVNQDSAKDIFQEEIVYSTLKGIRKSVGIGTQEFNKDISQHKNKTKDKKNSLGEQSKKATQKNDVVRHKFKESSTQTGTRDTTNQNVKQLYKRDDFDEKKRVKYQDEKEIYENTNKQQYQPQQLKYYKQNKKERMLRDFEEESTHQFQTHEISHPKRKSRKYGDNFQIETIVSCSIPPDNYYQWQRNSNEKELGRRAGRNYINRKVAGACCNRNFKHISYNNDINNFNTNELLHPNISLLPSASVLEQAIIEHRKYISAKEALENWKKLHTWKQHRKRFERSRNEMHQDNFDAATQTISYCPENTIRNKTNHYMQTVHPVIHDDMIVPSEKHLYQDFISKMEHCLQKHSRLCELNAKRNGEGKFTWVQDKYRRWHKITFDDYKH